MSKARASLIVAVTEKTFEREVLDASAAIPVLVDFWAPWCAPCKAISSTLALLAAKYEEQIKIVKLNVDRAEKLCDRYSVKALPTLLFFRFREEADRRVGVPAGIVEFIESAILKRIGMREP